MPNNNPQLTILRVYTDGASRGNPGKASAAFVIYNQNDEIVHQSSRYLGITSNNTAEYKGLLDSLTWLSQNTSQAIVHFYSDSLLIVKQILGEYKIKEPHLAELASHAHSHLVKLQSYTFTHIPRKNNALADQLCNQVLDQLTS